MRTTDRNDRKTVSLGQGDGGRGSISLRSGEKLKLAKPARPVGRGATFAERGMTRSIRRPGETYGPPRRKATESMPRFTGEGFTGDAKKARIASQENKWRRERTEAGNAKELALISQSGSNSRTAADNVTQLSKARISEAGATSRSTQKSQTATGINQANINARATEGSLNRAQDDKVLNAKSRALGRDQQLRSDTLASRITSDESSRRDRTISGIMDNGGNVNEAYTEYDKMQLLNKMTPEQRAQYIEAEGADKTTVSKKKNIFGF